jgi:hypothetical protein
MPQDTEHVQPNPEIRPGVEEALSRESMQRLLVADALRELGEFMLFLPNETLNQIRNQLLDRAITPDNHLQLVDQWDELARQQVETTENNISAQIGLELAKASLWLEAGERDRAAAIVNEALYFAENAGFDFLRERYDHQFDTVDERLSQLYP